MNCDKELINFCDGKLPVIITCDTVCSEGYEASNLISANVEKRRNGFMCDRFVKPPVQVTIKFPCHITVSHVLINPQVGQQRSSALEIYSDFEFYERSHSLPSTSAISSCTEKISFVRLSESDNGVVLFNPEQFRTGSKLESVLKPNCKEYKTASLTWSRKAATTNISSMTIRIVRTYKSSVPSIGFIEVWGRISRFNKRKAVEVNALWRTIKEKQSLLSQQESALPSSAASAQSERSAIEVVKDASRLDVPEDFLDSITYEIMALPMVLPSGKVVDQTTLDQHAKTEESWGRQPSDPFTGRSFSNNCKPVLDAALKSRIDKFLIENQDDIYVKTVARTVGRKSSHAQSSLIRVTVNEKRDFASVCEKDDSSKLTNKRPCPGVDHVETANKKVDSSSKDSTLAVQIKSEGVATSSAQLDSSSKVPSKIVEIISQGVASKSAHNQEKCSVGRLHKVLPPKNRVSGHVASKKESSSSEDSSDVQILSQTIVNSSTNLHDKYLDDSLDSALQLALAGRPSFVQFNNPNISENLQTACGVCSALVNLFELPCKHHLCRACLVNGSSKSVATCTVCANQFTRSEVVRFHNA